MGPIRPIFKEKRGATLVEMVVVVALFAMIGLALVYFSTGIVMSRARALSRIEAQEHARFALQRITYEIRRARGFELGSDFGVNLATTPSTSLDLDMREGANDPTVIDVSGGVVRLKQGAGPAIELTSDDVTVTNLTFDNRSSPTNRNRNVKITLTVENPDPGGDVDRDIVMTLISAAQARDR